MKLFLALWLSMHAPQDTVTFSVAEALSRGSRSSLVLQSARDRSRAAEARLDQAAAWPNPTLGLSAENVGQQSEFTGVQGARGLEGQAVVRFGLPLGVERSGRLRDARANADLAHAAQRLDEVAVRRELLGAIGAVLADQIRTSSAARELETVARLADALALQAESGRASRGEAARADLARGMASSRLARREAELASSGAELARLLGLAVGTPVRIEPTSCSAPGSAPPLVDPDPPEVRVARARVEAAEGVRQVARGLRLPDLVPEVGVRRTQGLTGLYLGLSTELPLFDRGSRRLDAAVADVSALEAEREDVERRMEAAKSAAGRTLEALTRGGAAFDATWFGNLELAVSAAEARFREGEGSLLELLDSRRARIQALDDYAAWQVEWWSARVEVARLDGRPIDGSLVCMDPFRETSR